MTRPERPDDSRVPARPDAGSDLDLDSTVRLTDAGEAFFRDNAENLSDPAFVRELILTIFGPDEVLGDASDRSV